MCNVYTAAEAGQELDSHQLSGYSSGKRIALHLKLRHVAGTWQRRSLQTLVAMVALAGAYMSSHAWTHCVPPWLKREREREREVRPFSQQRPWPIRTCIYKQIYLF